MARKAVGEMTKEELVNLIAWMEKRIKYMRYLMSQEV